MTSNGACRDEGVKFLSPADAAGPAPVPTAMS